MLLRTLGALAALALAFTSVAAVPTVTAQTPPSAQSDQDHKAHHPDAQAAPMPPPASPPQTGGQPGTMGQGGMMGGMMCGDMKEMMSMMQDMHAMMSAQSGMMASRVEAEITRLKSDLKITDTQAPHWNRFAESLRRLATSMDEMHQERMTMPSMAATLPDRFARLERTLLGYLNAVRATEESLQPLYAVLNDEQRKVANSMKIGPMGMM